MQLIEQKNHLKEFERFFNEYYLPVLRYCNTIVKDVDDAQDIVQQGFVSLWLKKDELNIHTSARAYLYKAVYNASLDFLNHEKVKKRYEKAKSIADKATSHTDSAIQNERLRSIELAISRLPEQCGRIFRLSKIEKLKYKEIAEQLNISEKTVENQMGKALKILRDALKELLPLLFMLISFYNDK
jgi:RNA polymerase sigma-70 factor, ECF subfamily